MRNLNQTLESIAKAVIAMLFCRRVTAGPFKNMRYAGSATGSTIMPKVLGTYELELQPIIVDWLGRKDVHFIDVGAAEGYYAVGLLFGNPDCTVTAYELSTAGRRLIAGMALRNGVSNRLVVKGECVPTDLADELKVTQGDVVILMDVEGAEMDLLARNDSTHLKRCEILVELHDWLGADLRGMIIARFASTHQCHEIQSRIPDISEIESTFWKWVARRRTSWATRLLQERPSPMTWLHLTPRTVL